MEVDRDGCKKLLMAVIRQWRDDGKPKTSEPTVRRYASMLKQANLVRSAETYRMSVLPDKLRAELDKEDLW